MQGSKSMTDTANLALPLVQPAQAQKHVTVNEALARIDGLSQLTLQSVSETVPPLNPQDGLAYGVPSGAVYAWAGQGGQVAIVIGGGWVFVPARRGWRAMVLDQGQTAVFDGAGWRMGAVSLTPGGASLNMRSVELDVTLSAGASVVTPLAFPARSIALGVTGRVTAAISGTATSWEIGVAGDSARYGTGLGLGVNAWVNGPGAPVVQWDATPLVIGAVGGDFAGGAVRLVAHFAELALPAET
jgi:hypothetical protein